MADTLSRQPPVTRSCRPRTEQSSEFTTVPERPGPGVGLGAVGELAVEAGADRPTIEEPQFPAGREQRRVGNRRGAGSGKKRARQRLKEGIENRRGHPVMRPGGAGVEREHGHARDGVPLRAVVPLNREGRMPGPRNGNNPFAKPPAVLGRLKAVERILE